MDPSTAAQPLDPTFRSYTAPQAAAYAAGRGSYSPALYEYILSQHKNNGGQSDLLLDVGCGTGSVARDLGRFFDRAMGLDPGEKMIDTARGIGGETRGGEEVDYRVCGAEDIDKVEQIVEGSVDLVVAAMAAHWFDMSKFWAAAARVLKPGGSVALWTCASLYCHPSTRNAPQVQQILSHLEDVTLAPYVLESNRMSRSLYAKLPLPWTCDPPIAEFDQSSFIRREWDVDGVLTNGQDFFAGGGETTRADLGSALGTASMVTRWREANPWLANGEKDCVKMAMQELREVLGVDKGSEQEIKLKTGSSTVVLFLRKQV
ncbi:S-adenosyl-L-methionine-dependent methyltransferase [Mycena venus]|uniref:S-adenosyl-L-methionine-dependent methyltransferase n=1 Tax=Mycena venus TaxID=2733690 RepID=A0A8H6YQ11_9AGAR|nr:S-adenosyl-L-methionine-dependent methyltransferase [Mycena venus]